MCTMWSYQVHLHLLMQQQADKYFSHKFPTQLISARAHSTNHCGMVSSLVNLCLSFVCTNIEIWGQHVTSFHIKEAQYLLTDMMRLPQEVVAKILQGLIECKKFSLQNLVLFLDGQFLRLELPSSLALVNDTYLKVIARLSKNIISLKPGSCSKLQQIEVLTQFTKLQCLDLVHCKAPKMDEILQQISYYSPSYILSKSLSVLNKSLSFLSTHCNTSLLELNLSQTTITSKCLSSLLSTCTLLQKLSLEGCFDVNDEAFLDLSPETNTELQELNITMCDIRDKSIVKIVTRFVDLKVLLVQGCPITDGAMRSVALLSSLKLLKLNATGISDKGILSLTKGKVPSTHLDLSNVPKIGDKGVEAVAQNLEHVGDRGISALASKCHNITFLSLASCSKVTDVGMAALLKSCRKLQHIVLDGLPITQSTITALSKQGNLQHLSLVSCAYIKASEEMVKICKRVKLLNVSNCTQISRQDAQKLRTVAPRTTVLWT